MTFVSRDDVSLWVDGEEPAVVSSSAEESPVHDSGAAEGVLTAAWVEQGVQGLLTKV